MKKAVKIQEVFDYQEFFQAISVRITSARINFSRQANREANALYWSIGKMIVKNQRKQGWGRSIVKTLAVDLKKKFPDVKFGFSERNLWNMRQFYLEYKEEEKMQRLVAEISWGANIEIMSKVKEVEARKYYIQSTIENGWTRNVLALQIKSQAYERQHLAAKIHNFGKVLPGHLAEQADRSLKSIYSLEMLGIAKPIYEKELNKRMVIKIKDVLQEFGRGFTFIGEEYRIVSPSGRESFIDLLCFNRILRSLIVIELKSGSFKPEYAGKMNYYLSLVDDQLKEPDENPTIGIILCTNKDRVDVEFALKDITKPIGVSDYKLTKVLPQDIADKMPDPDKLQEEILKEIDF